MSKHLVVTADLEAAATPISVRIPEMSGTATPCTRAPGKSGLRSSGVTIELIATVALALSTLVAITVVSIGIARADLLGARTNTVAPIALIQHD